MNRGMKTSMFWFFGVALASALLIFGIRYYLQTETQMVPVYVAKETLLVDMPIQADMLEKVDKHKTDVPDDAITDPSQIDGRYASSTIHKGDIVRAVAVSDAKTLREVVQKFGMNFGAVTVPVDTNDFPVDAIHVGDTVSLVGVSAHSTSAGTQIESKYVAQDVPVINVVTDSKSGTPKLVVAVPRDDALNIAKDRSGGKIVVVLDPRPFAQIGTQPMSQSPTQTQKTSNSAVSGAAK